MTEFDPAAAAVAWAKGAAGQAGDYRNNPAFDIALWWSKRDPAAARRWAESLTDEEARQKALNGWLAMLAHADPRAALDELPRCGITVTDGSFTVPGSGDGTYACDARTEIAGRLAIADFAKAIGHARRLALHYPVFIEEADMSEPDPAALEKVREMMTKYKGTRLPAEPAALLAELNSMARVLAPQTTDNTWPKEMDEAFFQNSVPLLSAEDSLTAARMRMASGVSEDDPLLSVLFRCAARSDPPAASVALKELPPEMGNAMVAGMAWAVPEDDMEHRLQLLRQIPPSQWRTNSVSQMAGHMSEYAPVIAALPAEDCGPVRAAFARQWADENPRAAAAWVATLPPSADGAETGALAAGWAAYDDAAASEWVAGLPPGAARDSAAAALVNVLMNSDPATAWQWIHLIAGNEVHLKMLKTLARSWDEPPVEFREACAAKGIDIAKLRATWTDPFSAPP